MSRRNRIKVPLPPQHFEEAFALIDKLEHSVIARMVVPEFTVDEMLDCMYGADVVNKMRAAWPIIQDIDRGRGIGADISYLPPNPPAIKFRIWINSYDAKILVPDGSFCHGDALTPAMFGAFMEARNEHLQFEKVRRVVRWLNDHATPGAARHYCPWLTSVLPADHPFQRANGLSYKEPAVGMAEIVPYMRECASIMARAILCGDVGQTETKSRLSVSFMGMRGGDAYVSNAFGLI